MVEGDGYKHFIRHARRYDMKDFLPSTYELEKRPKISKPSVAGSSHVPTTYEHSPKDEEASDHDQGTDSNDNNDVEVNYDSEALLKLQCYWELGEEDNSPIKVNKARIKRHNDTRESSSSDTVGNDEDGGMNVNDDDNSHDTSTTLCRVNLC